VINALIGFISKGLWEHEILLSDAYFIATKTRMAMVLRHWTMSPFTDKVSSTAYATLFEYS